MSLTLRNFLTRLIVFSMILDGLLTGLAFFSFGFYTFFFKNTLLVYLLNPFSAAILLLIWVWVSENKEKYPISYSVITVTMAIIFTIAWAYYGIQAGFMFMAFFLFSLLIAVAFPIRSSVPVSINSQTQETLRPEKKFNLLKVLFFAVLFVLLCSAFLVWTLSV